MSTPGKTVSRGSLTSSSAEHGALFWTSRTSTQPFDTVLVLHSLIPLKLWVEETFEYYCAASRIFNIYILSQHFYDFKVYILKSKDIYGNFSFQGLSLVKNLIFGNIISQLVV